ncbi:MAG: hypothetical protein MJA83_06215, partial [Gammaproteobacteria bacterium]|nr:hypothetical protein [Gammaproteobacteria bacterium]
ISNGENGTDFTDDGPELGINNDVPNTVGPSAAIETVNGAGNTKLKTRITDGSLDSGNVLQDGNVIRFSAWMRFDPSFPLDVSATGAPSVEPLIKVEAWKEALSNCGTCQDTNPGQTFPQFGDKVFDQQQHASQIGIFPVKDKNEWIDLGGDSGITDDPTAAGEGRVSSITDTEWTLVSTTFELNDVFWLGIGANNPEMGDIAQIEEIRATFYFGDWTALTSAPDATLEGGNILIDNIMVEIFADPAAEQALPVSSVNPDPTLDEIPFVAGDYNGNGIVDAADYAVWLATLGESGEGLAADGNEDLIVDQGDYSFWKNAFGNTSGAGNNASGAVPEPASSTLILLAGMGGIFASHRNRQTLEQLLKMRSRFSS